MANNSVLIVEDTPVNLKVMRVLLTRQGFDVRTATTAEEALQVLKEFTPRVVLTDIQLPGMDGLELIRRLKSDPSTHDTIVLAVTAFAMKGDEAKAFEAGCDGYVTKPIDTRTFPVLIRQYLNRAREASEETVPAEPYLVELRQEFVAEGMQQCKQLAGKLGAGFDQKEALVAAHRWAGAAGSIGYPDITLAAREMESVLQQDGSGTTKRIIELRVRLAQLFAAAQATKPAAPFIEAPSQPHAPRNGDGEDPPSQESVPADVALGLLAERQEAASSPVPAMLAGKRFALIGFPSDEAARVAKVLDSCHAFSRDLGTGALPDAEAVRPFDAVILHVASKFAIPEWNKPVLMIGLREVLRQQPAHGSAQDFLFSPWIAEDLALRAYFAVSQAAVGRPVQTARGAGGKRRVVVADDDSTIRALVEVAVENAGLECRVASDGGTALELIRSWQPDLAVLDVNMPNQSGYEVLASIRNDPLTRDIRVMLLTARQQETDVVRGFGLGADDYVIKPFSPMELIARLKRLLGKTV
jgi:CheY-like chemotaxis protein